MSRKRSKTKGITSIEVAKKAGVSQATVSRVFTNDPSVREKTKEKVMEAAEVLGYKPNQLASSLSSNKSNIIAVVLSDVTNRFYTKVFAYLTQCLQQFNKQVLFFQMRSEQDISYIINRVMEYRVDGLVIASPALPNEIAEECLKVNIPIVLFNRKVKDLDVLSVCSDSVEAGRMIANYFLDHHYTRFGFIGGRTTTTSGERKKGYLDRLAERGVTECIVEEGDYLYDVGRAHMNRIFQRENPPNAVFCANDIIAMGAVDAARFDLKLQIPKDVAIIGFDDIDISGWESYAITTIRQPMKEMVEEVSNYFYELEQNNTPQKGLRLFPCEMVERKTT
ncbi:MAG: LacI family DNA-binding transcriptional regulator [Lachnospiraceae bacterium]